MAFHAAALFTLRCLLHAQKSENMQVVAALIRNDDKTQFWNKFEEQVPADFADSEHRHHVEVFKVHLILDVEP